MESEDGWSELNKASLQSHALIVWDTF